MIYDETRNIEKYKGISKNLDRAMEFIKNTDLNSLAPGKIEIDGENVFANVMLAAGKEREELRFEVHKKYIDIQIDLDGTEIIDLGTGEQFQIEELDEQRDIGFCSMEAYVPCLMGEGKFLLLFAGEPHKPGIVAEGSRLNKKCVVKVLH